MKKNLFITMPLLVFLLAFLVVSCTQRYLSADSYLGVEQEFFRADYDLKIVRKNKQVPRVLFENIPENLNDIKDLNQKKELFIKITLPLVLEVNQELANDRKILLSVQKELGKRGKLCSKNKKILKNMKIKYAVSSDSSIENLLQKVDEVPVSLALSQAILESGWGTSRFTIEGNALYGQRTWTGEGIVPLGLEKGQNFKVKSFSSLYDSTKSYIDNLNHNKAYCEYRKARENKRMKNQEFSGNEASEYLGRYSEINGQYAKRLKSIIAQNNLTDFDDVKFARFDKKS